MMGAVENSPFEVGFLVIADAAMKTLTVRTFCDIRVSYSIFLKQTVDQESRLIWVRWISYLLLIS